jgi:hypothetical protein
VWGAPGRGAWPRGGGFAAGRPGGGGGGGGERKVTRGGQPTHKPTFLPPPDSPHTGPPPDKPTRKPTFRRPWTPWSSSHPAPPRRRRHRRRPQRRQRGRTSPPPAVAPGRCTRAVQCTIGLGLGLGPYNWGAVPRAALRSERAAARSAVLGVVLALASAAPRFFGNKNGRCSGSRAQSAPAAAAPITRSIRPSDWRTTRETAAAIRGYGLRASGRPGG